MSLDLDALRALITPARLLWAGAGAAVGVVVLLILLVVSALGRRAPGEVIPPTPVLVLIAEPSPTPTVAPPSTSTPEPTAPPTTTVVPGAGQGFGVGDLVEVSGTGGDGLRLRNSPDLDASINVLGIENEVFQVSDGPVEADGFTWWYLVNLVDQRKNGWAVGDFLRALGPR